MSLRSASSGEEIGAIEIKGAVPRSCSKMREHLDSTYSNYQTYQGGEPSIDLLLEWLDDWKFIDFARQIGKHFSVNVINRKESIKSRLGDGEGLSFTEYCYIFLQSADFLYLNEKENCTFQIGGSDPDMAIY